MIEQKKNVVSCQRSNLFVFISIQSNLLLVEINLVTVKEKKNCIFSNAYFQFFGNCFSNVAFMTSHLFFQIVLFHTPEEGKCRNVQYINNNFHYVLF